MRVCLVAGPVAVLAAGCGGRQANVVADAARASAAQPSEHVTIRSFARLGGKTTRLTGSGDFRNRPSRGRLQLTVDGSTLGEVMAGSRLYLGAAALPAQARPHRPWVSVDLRKVGTESFVSAYASLTPVQTFRKLERATGVSKVAAGHYSFTLSGEYGTAQHRRTVDVWVAAGRVRRVRDLDLYNGGGKAQLISDSDYQFSRYGEPVSVTVPPPGDTADMTKTFAKLLRQKGTK